MVPTSRIPWLKRQYVYRLQNHRERSLLIGVGFAPFVETNFQPIAGLAKLHNRLNKKAMTFGAVREARLCHMATIYREGHDLNVEHAVDTIKQDQIPAGPLNEQIDLGLWSETPTELRWQAVLRKGPLAAAHTTYRDPGIPVVLLFNNPFLSKCIAA